MTFHDEWSYAPTGLVVLCQDAGVPCNILRNTVPSWCVYLYEGVLTDEIMDAPSDVAWVRFFKLANDHLVVRKAALVLARTFAGVELWQALRRLVEEYSS